MPEGGEGGIIRLGKSCAMLELVQLQRPSPGRALAHWAHNFPQIGRE